MSYIEIRDSRGFKSLLGQSISLKTRLTLWRSRRALSKLDARQLDDIGITAEAAKKEARLALWDVPVNWTLK
ncbi:MAG: DUF1127 domain-containing protein [Roseobacter sp.]